MGFWRGRVVGLGFGSSRANAPHFQELDILLKAVIVGNREDVYTFIETK
jgi:hypothetical protein